MLKSFSGCLCRVPTEKIKENIRTMVRYFQNPYPDYKSEGPFDFNHVTIKANIKSYVEEITANVQPIERNVDGGLYVGISGIAYMFYHLSKNPHLAEADKQSFLNSAVTYIEPALKNAPKVRHSERTSFLLGNAGTYATAAIIYASIDKQKSRQAIDAYAALQKVYMEPNFLNCGSDELFVGRAGYLAGLFLLNRELGAVTIPLSEIYKICNIIVESGREFSKIHRSPCPLMYAYYKTQYIGAAHGISFILQMLITAPGYLNHNSSAAKDIKATIDYLLSIQTPDGNWPTCMEDIGGKEDKLVHWCHGAPGVVYLMAKAYQVFRRQKYLDACFRAGDLVWSKGLLRKGPGICHGVAGNAYVFLLLHKLTSNMKYLHRANAFVDFLKNEKFLREANTPDCPFSLYEGTAGTVCFLADLLVPEKACFPFQDVFTPLQF